MFFSFKTKLLNSDLKLTEEKGSSDGDEGEEVDFQVRSCDPAPHQLSELLTVHQQRVDLGHFGFPILDAADTDAKSGHRQFSILE